VASTLIGLQLKAGRFFTDADLVLTEKGKDAVAIVNQAFALHFFSGENPLGKRLLSGDKKNVSEIIGVVSDYRPMGVENGTRPQIFWPYLRFAKGSLIVRAKVASQSLGKAIQDGPPDRLMRQEGLYRQLVQREVDRLALQAA
jgi:hypothetical protein